MIRQALGLLLVVFVAGAASAAEKVPQYVGARGCKSCHKKDLIGDQYGEWLKGEHHKAFETLKSPKALEIAKKKGLTTPPSETPDCVKCHATSHGLTAAQIKKRPLVASDGVQCESCHGPGSLYKKKSTMSDEDKAVAAGLWDPGKDQKICTTCHNSDSPTWDPAKGFDYVAMKKKLAHPIPEAVKGRYLEEVKLRKARGESMDDDDDEEEE
ncbi:MAG TPA: multiheme c-type cytochrome [Myxococcota bacterium]|nr:multiheme c-type cytochrome [Myxococcota bacterium]